MFVNLAKDRLEARVFPQHGLAKLLPVRFHLFNNRLVVIAQERLALFHQVLALGLEFRIIHQGLRAGFGILFLLYRSQEGNHPVLTRDLRIGRLDIRIGLGVETERPVAQQKIGLIQEAASS